MEQQEKDMQEVQEISLDELKAHPETIFDALSQEHVSVVLRREKGGNIRIMKQIYDPAFVQTLQKADQELERRTAAGFTKEDAKKEFLELQDKIDEHIKSI
ncbi:MAG: hypothetical protein HQM14_18620 [SAR324 cluster bacterium]|nr:hypothetical protein [SAR324 cluster bacterium]